MLPCKQQAGYLNFEIPEQYLETQATGNSKIQLINKNHNTIIYSDHLADNSPVIVKVYYGRDLISTFREKLARFRVQREYDSLSFLKKIGIPTSEPVFWSYGTSKQYGRFEVLMTKFIPNSSTLISLAKEPGNTLHPEALSTLYRTLHTMHEKGFYHGALYPRNILLSPDTSGRQNVFIIDTPKAVIFPSNITGSRMAWFDLMDLSHELSPFISPDQLKTALSAYGFDSKQLTRFLRKLSKYKPSKHTRNRQRFEFTTRKVICMT